MFLDRHYLEVDENLKDLAELSQQNSARQFGERMEGLACADPGAWHCSTPACNISCDFSLCLLYTSCAEG